MRYCAITIATAAALAQMAAVAGPYPPLDQGRGPLVLRSHGIFWAGGNIVNRTQTGSENAGDLKNIPYADAKPLLETLREDLIPGELRARTPTERQSVWPRWLSQRDREIRARLERGDEDSIVNFLSQLK